MRQTSLTIRCALLLAACSAFAGCYAQTAAVDREGRPLQPFVVDVRSTMKLDRSIGRPLQQDGTPTTAAVDRKDRPFQVKRRMYVSNRSNDAITVYDDASNGNVVPLFRIHGSNTRLSAPTSIGFDGARMLYVLNAASIAVFAPGARGNAPPKFDIAGGFTQLSNPQGLAVDSTGKTYVTNSTGGQSYITAYAPGSNGNRAPVQTIYDGQSFFFVPSGIAQHGSTLYVADQGDQSINEYPATSNGIVNPTAVINGLNTPTGVAIDARGRIYVTDSDSIKVYAADANGYAKPLRVISGSQTLMNGAAGLTVQHAEISVANAGNDSIAIYPESGNGNIPPLRDIAGTNTGLSNPQSVAVR